MRILPSPAKRWLSGSPINMDDILRRFAVRHSRELAKDLDLKPTLTTLKKWGENGS